MSYQVLARKWRPQNFAQLVGQQHVVSAISNALTNDKLHHAYLFTGTRGVGKTTIARIFSKSLNCESGQSAEPCGQCNTCIDIDQGRYVDLLEIDAASRTKVEDTRDLLDNVQYRPTRGKYKVYLIDEVHMLSKHSFNALLKTLEEPPEHVKFLLATTDPQKLPVTILSRCLQFSLKALSREQISSQLEHILSTESISFDHAALQSIARAAEGSMRDALSLTDQAIAQGNNKVSVSVVGDMLGLLDKSQILRLTKAIIGDERNLAFECLNEICASAPDYGQIVNELSSLMHQISLTQIVPDVCKVETNHARAVYALAKAVTAEHIQLLYQLAINGKRDLAYAPDPLTGLQMIILRMLAFSPATKINTADIASTVVENAAVHTEKKTLDNAVDFATDLDTHNSADENHLHDEINDLMMQAETIRGAQEHETDIDTSAPSESLSATEDLLALHEALDVTEDESLAEEQALVDEPLNSLLASNKLQTPSVEDIQAEEAASDFELSAPTIASDRILSAYLDNGQKLTQAEQIDQWSALVSDLNIGGLTKQLLLQANLRQQGDTFKVEIEESNNHLNEIRHIESIKEALSEHFQKPVNFEVIVGHTNNTPHEIQTSINSMRQSHAEKTVESDQVIQQVLEIFEGKIIADSIKPR